ncbi:hypothetical protein CC1G_01661 [Coprinopsis cinerea okayama7|uniref:DUF6535 domain-containing protein n=1 Tax=Coprinopsis cinerea (strain Okayama-7 / 130 / ATCC MYA-4618 / FGSC 9003) TaxID=240176 RepID=A8NIE8_COPC7|nr:hypothetical protein CC1G_01661 [Coprinopsis cinerea okayama7\|eukprot:XP_001833984.2 hypothetical protein CC1G_01661 [Coprinopsis cinerea okayama7\
MTRSRYEPQRTTDPWEALDGILKTTDTSVCNAWKEEIEKLLVLAGLACAVVTPFAIESYRELKEDPQEAAVHLLSQVVSALGGDQRPQASARDVDSYSLLPGAGSAIRVNIFWFLSITLNLCTVFVGIICLQWIREYTYRDDNMSAKEASALRQMRYEGLVYWRVSAIISALPLFLQSSLILFFLGLLEFLWNLNWAVAAVITLVVLLLCAFFSLTTVLPALQSFFPPNEHFWTPQCPYKSSQAWLFHQCFSLFISISPSLPRLVRWFRGCSAPKQLTLRLQNIKDWMEFDLLWREVRDGVPWDYQGDILTAEQLKAQQTDGVDSAYGLASLIHNRQGINTYSIIHHCLQDVHLFTATQVLQIAGFKAEVALLEQAPRSSKRSFIAFHVLDVVFQRDERLRGDLLPYRLELFLELAKVPQLAPHVIPVVDLRDVRSDRMKVGILDYLADRYRSATSTYSLSPEINLGLTLLKAVDVTAIRTKWETFKPLADFALALHLWSRDHPSLFEVIQTSHDDFKPHLLIYQLFCNSDSSRNTVYSLQIIQEACSSSNDPFKLLSHWVHRVEWRELQTLAQHIISDQHQAAGKFRHNVTTLHPMTLRRIVLAEIVRHLVLVAPGLRSYYFLQVELYIDLYYRTGTTCLPWPIRNDEDLRFLLSYGSPELLRGLLDVLIAKMQQGHSLQDEGPTLLFCLRILNPVPDLPMSDEKSFAKTLMHAIFLWPSAWLSRCPNSIGDTTSGSTSISQAALRTMILSALHELGWTRHFPNADILEALRGGPGPTSSVTHRFHFLMQDIDIQGLLDFLDIVFPSSDASSHPPSASSLEGDIIPNDVPLKDVSVSLALLFSMWFEKLGQSRDRGAILQLQRFSPHRIRMYLHVMSAIPGVYIRGMLRPPWQDPTLDFRAVEFSKVLLEVVLNYLPWIAILARSSFDAKTSPLDIEAKEPAISGLMILSTKERRDREFAWSLVYSALLQGPSSSSPPSFDGSPHEFSISPSSPSTSDSSHTLCEPEIDKTNPLSQVSLEYLRGFSNAIARSQGTCFNGESFPCDALHVRFLLSLYRSREEGHRKVLQSKEVVKGILRPLRYATILNARNEHLDEQDMYDWRRLLDTCNDRLA